MPPSPSEEVPDRDRHFWSCPLSCFWLPSIQHSDPQGSDLFWILSHLELDPEPPLGPGKCSFCFRPCALRALIHPYGPRFLFLTFEALYNSPLSIPAIIHLTRKNSGAHTLLSCPRTHGQPWFQESSLASGSLLLATTVFLLWNHMKLVYQIVLIYVLGWLNVWHRMSFRALGYRLFVTDLWAWALGLCVNAHWCVSAHGAALSLQPLWAAGAAGGILNPMYSQPLAPRMLTPIPLQAPCHMSSSPLGMIILFSGKTLLDCCSAWPVDPFNQYSTIDAVILRSLGWGDQF